ncbi:TetR/AcrR family transcriptional regulator [Holzapfeliella sp. JNUCC 80]
MAYENKTNLTQKKIKRAFLEILTEKKFDSVTIGDIVNKAGIHRSSFYRYYEDKYQLAGSIEYQIMCHLREKRKSWMAKNPDIDLADPDSMMHLFLAINDFAPAINILLSQNGDPSFEVRLRNVMMEKFFRNSKYADVSSDKLLLLREFSIDMIIQTYKYWASPNKELSAKELANLLSDIYQKGFRHAVENI